MADGRGAFAQRDFDLVFRDHGTGERGAEQILVFVHRARFQRGPDVAGQELFAQILDNHLAGSGFVGLVDDGLDVVSLAHVGDHGDHFVGVVFLEPRNDDGGIEPTGIGENNSFLAYACALLGREAAHAAAQQPYENGFLNVQTVFRLIEHDRVDESMTWSVTSQPRCAGRQCMNSALRLGELHERGIHLVRAEDGGALFRFLFVSHAGPGIGVNGVGSGDGFARVGQDAERSLGFVRDGLRHGHDDGIEPVALRRGNGNFRADAKRPPAAASAPCCCHRQHKRNESS